MIRRRSSRIAFANREMRRCGIKVLRFSNALVLENPKWVVTQILDHAKAAQNAQSLCKKIRQVHGSSSGENFPCTY